MKFVSIEKLLQWAFREELPKRQQAPAAPRSALSSLGVRVNVSFRDRGFPHRDALIIAAHVEALGSDLLELNTRRWLEFILDDLINLDSERFEFWIDKGALVERSAVTMRRPQWDVGSRRAGPLMSRNGKPRMRGDRYGKDRYSEGSYCPLRWSPSIRSIALARTNYFVWQDALCELARSLNGKLSDFSPTPPMAGSAPWLRPSSVLSFGSTETPHVFASSHV